MINPYSTNKHSESAIQRQNPEGLKETPRSNVVDNLAKQHPEAESWRIMYRYPSPSPSPSGTTR